MSMERYFERVSQKINALSDDEFMELLVKSGLTQCPLEEESYESSFYINVKYSPFDKKQKYGISNLPESILMDLKVA